MNIKEIFKSAFDEFPVIEFDEFRLRKLTHNDANDIFEIFSNPEVVKYYDLSQFTSLDQSEKFIKMHNDRYVEKKSINWCIELLPEKKIIGNCRIYPHMLDYQNSEKIELGYDLNYSYWLHGYMKSTLKEIIKFCFSFNEVKELYIGLIKENIQNIKLVEKLNFKYSKEIKDVEIMPGNKQDISFYTLLK